MAEVKEVRVKLVLDTDEFVKSVDGAEKEIGELNKSFKATDGETKQLEKLFSSLQKRVIGFLAIEKIKDFGLSVISITSDFQKFGAVLANTLGSTSKANRALQDIQNFAASTPFSVAELTEAFVKLANSGFVPTVAQLTSMGDLASSVGKNFNQLSEAIIDALSGHFARLNEFGIRSAQSGDKVTFTFKGVNTTVQNTSAAVKDYILSLGNLQGVSGGMAAISKTLGGQISNLGDSFDAFKNTLGQALSPIISTIIEKLGKLLNFMTDGVAVVGAFVSKILMNNVAMNALKALILPIVAGLTLYILHVGRLAVAKVRLAIATRSASVALRAFNLVTKANPFGIIITALTTVTALFLTFKEQIYNTIPALETFADKAVNVFERVKIAAKDFFNLDTVVDKATEKAEPKIAKLQGLFDLLLSRNETQTLGLNIDEFDAFNAELKKAGIEIIKMGDKGKISSDELKDKFEQLKKAINIETQVRQVGDSLKEFTKGLDGNTAFNKISGELQRQLIAIDEKELANKLKTSVDDFITAANKGAKIRQLDLKASLPGISDADKAKLSEEANKLSKELNDALTPQEALEDLQKLLDKVSKKLVVTGNNARDSFDGFRITKDSTQSLNDFAQRIFNLTRITSQNTEEVEAGTKASTASTEAKHKEIKEIELKTDAIIADTEAIKANIKTQEKQQDIVAKQIALLESNAGKLLTIDLNLNIVADENITQAQDDITKAFIKLNEDRDKELLSLEEQRQDALKEAREKDKDGVLKNNIDLVKLEADYAMLRLKIETEYQTGKKEISDAGQESLLQSEKANQANRLLELKKFSKEQLDLLKTVQAETQVIANEQIKSFIDKLVTDFESAADKLGTGLDSLLVAKRIKAQVDFDFNNEALEKERQDAEQTIGRAQKDLDGLTQEIADVSGLLTTAQLGGDAALAERLSVRLKGLQQSFTEAVTATDAIVDASEEKIKQADLKLIDITRKKFEAILEIERKSTEERIKIQEEFIVAQQRQLGLLANGLDSIADAYKKFVDNPNIQKRFTDTFNFDVLLSGLSKFTEQFKENFGKFQDFSKTAIAQNIRQEEEATRLKIQNLDAEIESRRKFNVDYSELEAQKGALQQQSSDLAKSFIEKEQEFGKQRTLAILDLAKSFSDTVIATINEALQSSIDALDIGIEDQKNRVNEIEDALTSGGEAAKKYSATVLEAEKERLDKLQKLREEDVQRQRSLALIQLLINTAIAVSKAAAEGGVLAPVTIAITLVALAAGLIAARQQAESAIPTAESGGVVGEGKLVKRKDKNGKVKHSSGQLGNRGSDGGGILTGRSHRQGGILIEAESGEAIIPTKAVAKNRTLVEWLIRGKDIIFDKGRAVKRLESLSNTKPSLFSEPSIYVKNSTSTANNLSEVTNSKLGNTLSEIATTANKNVANNTAVSANIAHATATNLSNATATNLSNTLSKVTNNTVDSAINNTLSEVTNLSNIANSLHTSEISNITNNALAKLSNIRNSISNTANIANNTAGDYAEYATKQGLIKIEGIFDKETFANNSISNIRDTHFGEGNRIKDVNSELLNIASHINLSNKEVIEAVHILTKAVKNSKGAEININEKGISAITENATYNKKRINKLIKRG